MVAANACGAFGPFGDIRVVAERRGVSFEQFLGSSQKTKHAKA